MAEAAARTKSPLQAIVRKSTQIVSGLVANRLDCQTVKFLIKGQLMERIIRSNAVETSSKLRSTGINLHDLHPHYELASKMTPIYGGNVAPITATFPETPTNIHNTTAKNPQATITNTGNWSKSLQTLLDEPPSRLPHRVMSSGVAFFTLFGVCAWTVKIEEIGHAKGQLVPLGETYQLHPQDLGKIVNINVKKGQEVKAGQVVAELDTALLTNEVEGQKQQLATGKIQLNQVKALIDWTRLQAKNRAAMAAAEEKTALSAISSAKARLATSQQLLAQMQAQHQANIVRRKRIKPLHLQSKEVVELRKKQVMAYRKRLKRIKSLLAKGDVSRDITVAAKQVVHPQQTAITKTELQQTPMTRQSLLAAERTETNTARFITQSQGEMQRTIKEIQRLQAQLAKASSHRRSFELEAQQQIQQLSLQQTQLQAKMAETQTLLNNTKTKLKQRFIYAPVDGVVSSVNINRIGEVVQAGQIIAEIAPRDKPLILVATLANQEASFVKKGMPVQIKINTQPHQDYEIISGKVISISPDEKNDENVDKIYRVEVALDNNSAMQNKQHIKFQAGQTATAEIIINHRRITDMLLEPIKQLQRERVKSN